MRIITAWVWALGMVAAVAGIAGAARPAQAPPRDRIFLGFLEYQAGLKFQCGFINEDVVGGGQWGSGGTELPPLPAGLKAKGLVPFLRKNLPGYVVWRDRVNKAVIHVVDRRVLAWKLNPLDKKVTIQETTSVEHLQSNIFAKEFPKVHFYDAPYRRVNPIPYFPDLKAFSLPIKFDVKNITLRRFLTTGIPYRTGPKHLAAGLWCASYQFRGGKLTGRVTIIISGNPLVLPPAATQRNARAKRGSD